jgi:hypothetical protein
MPRLAITFRIRPGTEEKVRELLANYPAPSWQTADGARLVSTSVFMKDQVVVRMIEVDGAIPSLIRHIAQEPNIQNVERELDQYVVDEDRRDFSAPGGARDFFRKAMMEHVTTRIAPPVPADAEPATVGSAE